MLAEVHVEFGIITFDGAVIEVFWQGKPSERYHVQHVKTAEVQTDRKGRHSLNIQFDPGGGIASYLRTDLEAAQAQQLVSEIQKARMAM